MRKGLVEDAKNIVQQQSQEYLFRKNAAYDSQTQDELLFKQ